MLLLMLDHNKKVGAYSTIF